MNRQEHNTRDSMWLLVLGWLAAQSAILLAILTRVLRRKEERPVPEVQRPQATAIPTSSAEASQEKFEDESGASRLAPYWDVIGLTSVAITIAGAATFYIAGWFYEAHWYGYYGIEVSQIELVPYQIMVQGVPGILLLVLSISLSLAMFLIWKPFSSVISWFPKWVISWFTKTEKLDLNWKAIVNAQDIIRVERKEVLLIVVRAYFSANFLVVFGALGLAEIGTRGVLWEVYIIIASGFIILTLVQVVATLDIQLRIWSALFTGEYHRIPFSRTNLTLALPVFILFLIIRILRWITRWLPGRRFRVREALSGLDEETQEQLRDFLKQLDIDEEALWDPGYFLGKLFGFYSCVCAKLIDTAFTSLSRFWLGLILLMFFLVSISASSLLGEFDALRGARSLSGDWHLPMVFLFSERPVSVLQGHEQENDQPGFVYGPFGLVTSNESTLFLAEWKETQYYEKRPTLYLVPQRPEQALYLSQPTSTLTPTATPTLSPNPSVLTPTLTVVPSEE